MPGVNKGASLMRWGGHEKEAICKRLATDHVHHGTAINTKRIHELSKLEGEEWRPRPSGVSPSYYKKFLVDRQSDIDRLVQQARQQQQRAESKPPAVIVSEPTVQVDVSALTHQPNAITFHPEPTAAAHDETPLPTLPGSAMTLGQFIDTAMRQQMEEALSNQARDLTLALSSVLNESFRGIPGFDAGRFLPRPAPQHKRVVLVANADAKQLESIRKEFPFLEIVGMGLSIPENIEPDLVVGINLFGTNNLDRQLRKRFGRSYVPSFGGADACKRSISVRMVDPRLVSKREQSAAAHH